MPRLSQIYKLGMSQGGLDFVDTRTEQDIPVFIEPFALSLKKDLWSSHCTDHIVSFFQAVVSAIKKNDDARARYLLSYLGEPNETGLGYAQRRGAGTGVTGQKAERLFRALKKSGAVKTGIITDLGEAELFIEGISVDGISDLTTNIIRGPLIDFTIEQCSNWDIPLQHNIAIGHVWDVALEDWTPKNANLPVVRKQPQIMVPKYAVRRGLLLNSQEYYSKHIINFIQLQEAQTRGLTRVLRGSKHSLTKKEIKEKHPFSKEFLTRFTSQHPAVLQKYKDLYKKLPGASGIVSDSDLTEGFSEIAFSQALIDELRGLPAGPENADRYHKLILGICELVFFPNLTLPTSEYKLHGGRKRIDILYTNAAEGGFFSRLRTSPQTKSIIVPCECKNYSEDPKNPQLDQLASYFGETRGWFGFLFYRTSNNDDLIMTRCADSAKDGRGLIVPLSDSHVIELLTLIARSERINVDGWLQRRLNAMLAK